MRERESERVRNACGGGINRTFKDVWGIHFFRVALFCYGDLVRDLDKVDTGGEIGDAT